MGMLFGLILDCERALCNRVAALGSGFARGYTHCDTPPYSESGIGRGVVVELTQCCVSLSLLEFYAEILKTWRGEVV